MKFEVVSVSWCKPISLHGLDVSLVPARGAIVEILTSSAVDPERLFMGDTDDLRATLLGLISGRADDHALGQRVLEQDAYFRYWLCDSRLKRSQVAAALWDRHAYECGGSWQDLGGSFVRVTEED